MKNHELLVRGPKSLEYPLILFPQQCLCLQLVG